MSVTILPKPSVTSLFSTITIISVTYLGEERALSFDGQGGQICQAWVENIGKNQFFDSTKLVHACYLKDFLSQIDKSGAIGRKKRLVFKHLPFVSLQMK